jgi:hypothetical protein
VVFTKVYKFEVGRDLQTEALKQDCLVVGGSADTALADRDAGECGQHDIDQEDTLELGEDLVRFVAETGALAPLAQGFPELMNQKTNRDVRLYATFGDRLTRFAQ